jgi:hypothetical protein
LGLSDFKFFVLLEGVVGGVSESGRGVKVINFYPDFIVAVDGI